MRVTDMLGLALSALRQHRLRTVLTTLGVVFGTLVLAASVSIGLGVDRSMQTLLQENQFLRQIQVHPDWQGPGSDKTGKDAVQIEGKMSETRRQRLAKAIARRRARLTGESGGITILSREKLAELGAMNHVESVMPYAWQEGYAVFEGKSQMTDIAGARPNDASWRNRIIAGRFIDTERESAIVVSEALLYLLGVTDEASVDGVLGRKLRIEFRRWARGLTIGIRHQGGIPSLQEALVLDKVSKQLPQVIEKLDLADGEKDVLRKAVATEPADAERLYAEEFTIVGVIRAPADDEQRRQWHPLRPDSDVVLPFQTAVDLYFHRAGTGDEISVDGAVVLVDHEKNVEGVLAELRRLGLQCYSSLEQLSQVRLIYLLIFSGMTCVALVSLVVAGLGIANTMLISVLQRTREIGIMKAVGADSRHLQFVFLVEGALIGCVGGVLGLLLAWAASFPADAWIQSMASRDLKVELKESICAFPLWLPLAVFCFSVAITIIAALYPSRRAAGIDPVAALRYE